MKQTDYLIGIFHQFNPNLSDLDTFAYYFLYILDQKGEVAIEEKKQSFEGKDIVGPFQTIEELNQFAYKILEQSNAEKISLVSIADYNLYLEKNSQALDFFQDLILNGNVLLNIEKDDKKKGLFKRLFS